MGKKRSILVGKSNGNIPLAIERKYETELTKKERVCNNWTHVAHNMDKMWANSHGKSNKMQQCIKIHFIFM
jgi:hypothetical protein